MNVLLNKNARLSNKQACRVIKSSRLSAKMGAYLVSIGQLLCLAFLYGLRFLNKISLNWRPSLTTQPSTSKLSDHPVPAWFLHPCNHSLQVMIYAV